MNDYIVLLYKWHARRQFKAALSPERRRFHRTQAQILEEAARGIVKAHKSQAKLRRLNAFAPRPEPTTEPSAPVQPKRADGNQHNGEPPSPAQPGTDTSGAEPLSPGNDGPPDHPRESQTEGRKA